MLLFGSIANWVAFIAVLVSTYLYVVAPCENRMRTLLGRAAFITAAVAITASTVTLAALLATHRFDAQYVYDHTARGMASMYLIPSLWSGQEGSFLLWAFWTAILGVALAFTAGTTERCVMPIYNLTLGFLTLMLLVRSPFHSVDTHGMPAPTDELGLDPNLENPWMAIHPPTLFLGMSTLGVLFSYALTGLVTRDRTEWFRRARPWGLFGFASVGLAMMMGGYWAYEMLAWGGFWGWDPVENGPLVPFLLLLAFLHSGQVQSARGGLVATTSTLAMLPYVAGLYEAFLTRTGILAKFSVHSFSTLGGVGNELVLGALLCALSITVIALFVGRRDLRSDVNVWDTPGSKEFGYLIAVILFVICAIIAAVGMSAPLLTTLGQKLHLTHHVATVKEDFYNRATFPIAVLLALGMGSTPLLRWKKSGVGGRMLARLSIISIIATVIFGLIRLHNASQVTGLALAGQFLLFAASTFAVIANGYLGLTRVRGRRTGSESDGHRSTSPGGLLCHIGAAVFLIGIVCLVTMARKDTDVLLVQGEPQPILGGSYLARYVGQTSDFVTDKNNALKFDVVSRNGHASYSAYLPLALRAMGGSEKQVFSHPAIIHGLFGDIYLALKDGPTAIYKSPLSKLSIPVGQTVRYGDCALTFIRFDRDPQAVAALQSTGKLPARFPITAVLRVAYRGETSTVRPVFILRSDVPDFPETPEVKLPGGSVATFQGMGGGSDNSTAEVGSFTVREDTGPPREAFDLEITTRPMVGLIWIGTILMVLGGLLAMRRRGMTRSSADIVPEVAREAVAAG